MKIAMAARLGLIRKGHHIRRLAKEQSAGSVDELNTTLIMWIFAITACGVIVGLIASALFSDVNSIVSMFTNLF